MYQVIVRIFGVPLYGFGVMLCIAYFLSVWVAGRRAERVGINRLQIQDLALWVLIAGIVGARLAFIEMEDPKRDLTSFFRIWDGGLVLYGSIAGGVLGYFLAYLFVLRKHGTSTWTMADVIAPALAVGIGLGRIGCLLNGCCYGEVACADCVGVAYPLSAPPRYALTHDGRQTAAGFTLPARDDEPATVGAVEPGSPAEQSGLRPGDRIVKADDRDIRDARDLNDYLANQGEWPRGKRDLTLTVLHANTAEAVELPAFVPWTLRLHPTQVYETVSMALLLLVLFTYEPFKRRDGELMALMMIGYGIHRYVNEMLRSDPRPVGFESYVSLFLVGAGVVIVLWRRRLPARAATALST